MCCFCLFGVLDVFDMLGMLGIRDVVVCSLVSVCAFADLCV